jgi:hypothetical protein
MSIIVAILLGALALAFVLYPLYHSVIWRWSGSPKCSGEGGRVGWSGPLWSPGSTHTESAQVPILASQPLIQQTDREQTARAALQEVEFDYQLGNLDEDDYRTLRERYMRRALTALKFRHDHEQAIDDAIEEQLRKLREEHEHGTT